MKYVALDRWTLLIGRTSKTATAESSRAVFDNLCLRYSSTQRRYDDLRHIDACLGALDSVRGFASQPDRIELAIWFHDAIYDSRKSNNEEASAELAKKTLADFGVSDDIAQSVNDLILATRHNSPPTDSDAALLIDIDLAVLGQPAAVFDQYETDIRWEYDWVSEPDFRAGRSRILQSFLARETIYSTDYFRNAFESAARGNLARSLAALNW